MKGGFKRIVILACFERRRRRRHQRGDRAETKRSRADFSCSSVRRSKSDKVKPNFGRAERIKFNAVFLHIRRGRLSFCAFSYGTDCIASHAYSAKCREEESRLGGRGRRRKGPREKEREHGVFFSVGRQKTAPTLHHTKHTPTPFSVLTNSARRIHITRRRWLLLLPDLFSGVPSDMRSNLWKGHGNILPPLIS